MVKAHHAPKGGENIGGKDYAGGQFAPDPNSYVKSPDGRDHFGIVTTEMVLEARKQGVFLSPGPIRLQYGEHDHESDQGFGLAHIEARHGSQIRDAGFEDAATFVHFVLERPDELLKRQDGSIFLARRTGQHSIVAISLDTTGATHEPTTPYRVHTAYSITEGRRTKGTVLWSRAAHRDS